MIKIEGVCLTLRNAKRSRSPPCRPTKADTIQKGRKRSALYIASVHDDANTVKQASTSHRRNTLPRRFVQQSREIISID